MDEFEKTKDQANTEIKKLVEQLGLHKKVIDRQRDNLVKINEILQDTDNHVQLYNAICNDDTKFLITDFKTYIDVVDNINEMSRGIFYNIFYNIETFKYKYNHPFEKGLINELYKAFDTCKVVFEDSVIKNK